MITVVGWPRSGTHWLKTMLGHALGEEVAQSHMWPETEGKYVLIVRDPRDAFASHWRLYRHDNPGTSLTELDFVDYFMKGEGLSQPWGVGWVPHTRKLFEMREVYPLAFYERLYTHPEVMLSRVLSGLYMGVPLSITVEAVRSTKGVRCDPSTLPVDVNMGLPGKWKHELQPATVWALEDYCGELMDELGYARSVDG